MECECRLDIIRTDRYYDRMPSIVSPGTSCTDIDFSGKDVYQLAFAFVTPLRAQHNRHYMGLRRCLTYERGGGSPLIVVADVCSLTEIIS
jgi:hypothetical protein